MILVRFWRLYWSHMVLYLCIRLSTDYLITWYIRMLQVPQYHFLEIYFQFLLCHHHQVATVNMHICQIYNIQWIPKRSI